jgi:hypothetical protein
VSVPLLTMLLFMLAFTFVVTRLPRTVRDALDSGRIRLLHRVSAWGLFSSGPSAEKRPQRAAPRSVSLDASRIGEEAAEGLRVALKELVLSGLELHLAGDEIDHDTSGVEEDYAFPGNGVSVAESEL